MAFIITLQNYFFRIIIKNLMKCSILSTFAFKNYDKFADHNLEKLCPRSLTSTIAVLGLERVSPRKVGLWPWPGIFWSPLPWSQTLCPRLHLRSLS